LLIETSDKGISGFIVGRIVPGPDAEIYNIGVRQSVRQLGLGRLLLAKFISRCTAANVNNIWLEVRYSNASAVSFYEGFGFRETAVRPAFYSDPVEDARIMKLIISA
jgi:ribosomal-protein-alanine acetyltransferase